MKKSAAALVIAAALCAHSAIAAEVSGWSIAPAGMWRISEDADYAFSKGSPARMVRADQIISNTQARYMLRKGLVNTFSFKVGCVFQSKTPAFELDVQPLDVRISDQFNGYAFVRFLVDGGKEYSLRGEYLPPARLVFAPLTQSQDKSISDIFLQLREGGRLSMALLEGEKNPPRVFEVPLTGFMEFSDKVVEDCARLNQGAGVRTKFLPDYVTKEPGGYAPKHNWTLKPQAPNDGLNKPEEPAPKEEPKQPEKPEVQYFEPGGGPASIGPDGKPVVQDGKTDPDAALGTASGPLQIGPDGKPVSSAAGGNSQGTADQAQAAQETAPSQTGAGQGTPNNTTVGQDGVPQSAN